MRINNNHNIIILLNGPENCPYVFFYINTVTDVGVVMSQSDYVMDLATNKLYFPSDHNTLYAQT